jgi:hypothetical protein
LGIDLQAITFWYNARVHECGKSEIGQHEERDERLNREDPWVAGGDVIVAPENAENVKNPNDTLRNIRTQIPPNRKWSKLSSRLANSRL